MEFVKQELYSDSLELGVRGSATNISGEPLTSVRIQAAFFDAEGKKVTEEVHPVSYVRAGTEFLFDVDAERGLTAGEIDSVEDHQLGVQAGIAEQGFPDDDRLEITDHQFYNRFTGFGVEGAARNTSSDTALVYATIVAIFYDSEERRVGAGRDLRKDIPTDAEFAFDAGVSGSDAYVSGDDVSDYELVVSGDSYND